MKIYRILFAIAFLALINLLLSSGQTLAASTKPKEIPPEDTRNLIHAINAAAGTIEIEYMRNKQTHTYSLDDITMIKVNNVPGKITDIKTGMQVRDYVERDDHTLDKIVVDKADPAPSVPKAK
jgi:hypothetical protein